MDERLFMLLILPLSAAVGIGAGEGCARCRIMRRCDVCREMVTVRGSSLEAEAGIIICGRCGEAGRKDMLRRLAEGTGNKEAAGDRHQHHAP